ncbi:MAG: hypothetical protein AUK47_00725 [Deltaproteobacteria bacterium CG2_30_63_29]|nr:MAG: hypothetical protein AUK47_00725 [Deltaproteobacteria bacterium CG2_30_63_29]PJB37860.1 MAG: hypothetical protein CO108_20240 [Deltaproteobacteria bacterium CG_4_9_14_3_um_filter_63_12]
MTKAPLLKQGQILANTIRVDSPVGAGGFALIYTGFRLDDQAAVIIKALRADAEDVDPVAVKRFIREAAVAAQLEHPNIVRTLSFGQTRDNVLYIVLERLNGQTLANAMFEEPVEPELVHELLRQMLSALSYAHSHGIVHRDIKPSNLFVCAPGHRGSTGELEEDTVKLLDFGFVKVLKMQEKPGAQRSGFYEPLTKVGQAVGTPGYMAPEVLRGQEATHLVDLYAVGVLAYELLTGKAAFDGVGLERAMNQMSSKPTPPPLELAKLPLFAIVWKLIEANPKKRYQSAADALADLARIDDVPAPEKKGRGWLGFIRGGK